MKKLFKYIFTFLFSFLITTLLIGFYFRTSISLILNVFDELKNSNKSVETLNQFIDFYSTKTMDIRKLKYKDTNSKNVYLDIYKSTLEDKASKVILYVHGGSWIYGDNGIPIGMEPIIDSFNKEGFTIISLSYNLLNNNNSIYDSVCDVKDAIRWIYKNEDVYNFDTNEIGILGISSGANLALLSAYSKDIDFKGDENLYKYSSKVKYIIDVFGPTNLETLNFTSLEDTPYYNNLNSLVSSKEYLKKYSPINYVKENLPTTLIIHSKSDELVPYSNAKDLYTLLKENNNKTKLLSLNTGSHYFSGYSTFEVISLIIETLKFLDINT